VLTCHEDWVGHSEISVALDIGRFGGHTGSRVLREKRRLGQGRRQSLVASQLLYECAFQNTLLCYSNDTEDSEGESSVAADVANHAFLGTCPPASTRHRHFMHGTLAKARLIRVVRITSERFSLLVLQRCSVSKGGVGVCSRRRQCRYFLNSPLSLVHMQLAENSVASLAATAQIVFGAAVPAGGLFAHLTSAGMGGYGLPVVNGVVQAGAAVAYGHAGRPSLVCNGCPFGSRIPWLCHIYHHCSGRGWEA